jgi:tRNA dimethylallyltransferase
LSEVGKIVILVKKGSKYLIVIAGPTAVGKSDMAISLANWLSTEIISADSRQIYRQMNIGTAKPTDEQLTRIKHHFINELDITESFSAANFEMEALKRLRLIYKTRQVAILCGGTGLYINALCSGLDKIPDVNIEWRHELEDQFSREGLRYLQQQIITKDPKYASMVDMQNHRRLIRALGVIHMTGKPFSSFLHATPQPRDFNLVKILLTDDRKNLYQRINYRVDKMIASGLEDEVSALGAYRDAQAMQTVGYQEWFYYFDGVRSREETIELIKRNSRRYAKRQMTWFRKHNDWTSFPYTDENKIREYITAALKGH